MGLVWKEGFVTAIEFAQFPASPVAPNGIAYTPGRGKGDLALGRGQKKRSK
jgi:hypothetical protein